MSNLVPLALFGWPLLTIILFAQLKPHRAVLISVIGGWLLLPMAGYDFPLIPAFDKYMAISLGLLLGGYISGKRRFYKMKWSFYDLPMLIWCFSSLPTSISNGLGIYDGLSGTVEDFIRWGIPYMCGRIYFQDIDALRDLCLGIVLGGLLYVPLCLFELRMSPKLHYTFYGFFPHSFIQHVRYGGYRPIVFMQHGLMVSLWMACTSVISFWLWRGKIFTHIHGIPMFIVFSSLAVVTFLTKSANGMAVLVIGCGLYFLNQKFIKNIPILVLMLLIPFYISMRVTNGVTGDEIAGVIERLLHHERIESLVVRFNQEDLYSLRGLERPLFGWGGYGRTRPVDPHTGEVIMRAIDSLWLLSFCQKGFVGLISLFSMMLVGPYLTLRNRLLWKKFSSREYLILVSLSLFVLLFMLDCLLNAMVNPAFALVAGTLIFFRKYKPAPEPTPDKDSALPEAA